MKNLYKQIDTSIPKSKSKWECICPSCNITKILHWNSIRSKINNNQFICLTCILKKRNKTLTKNEEIKKKLRSAKLGKSGKNTNNWRGGNFDSKEYYNKNKEKLNKRKRTKYRASLTAAEGKRRAAKLNQTPNWLSKEHCFEILLIYKKANELSKNSNIKYHVDHIIPLQGKEVRGLHVPWNLQILEDKINIKKGNKVK